LAKIDRNIAFKPARWHRQKNIRHSIRKSGGYFFGAMLGALPVNLYAAYKDFL
jgi:hypothetical protein